MLTLRATLLRDVFEGGRHDDPRSAEWPPSWMRVFSALVSVAGPESADDAILRRLENAPPPSIHASPALTARRDAFVPTNKLLDETRHTNLPGRTNGERTWARAIPRSREIWYRWNDLTLDVEETRRLVDLCRRVPYLGRSTSPAVIEVVEGDAPERGWLEPLVDVAPDEPVALADAIRCPFPGALDALRAAYDERFRLGETGDPWQIGRGVDYGSVVPTPPRPTSGPYEAMVVLRLLGRRLDGRHTARVAHAVRRALLARAGEPVAALHGHHDGEVVQVAFLGLLDVGHQHADGHLLGVALALPALVPSELAVIGRALPGTGEVLEVTCGPLGIIRFERISPLDASTRLGLRAARWTGPARRWASVTPVVLDRYPGRGGDLEAEVRRAVAHVRLPDARVVGVSRDPVVAGSPRFTPTDTLRRPGDRMIPYRHAVIEFAVPVRGPVVLGSMRHYGLGLCAPVEEHEEHDEESTGDGDA
jgi:CRISPR-associated protein Csb2